MRSYRVKFIENAEEPFIAFFVFEAENFSEMIENAKEYLLPRQFNSIISVKIIRG